MTSEQINDRWGWCSACHSMYSSAGRENPWSCPAGGRHNRNARGDELAARAGRYGFRTRRGDAQLDAPDAEPTSVAPLPVAHWPLSASEAEMIGNRRSSVVGAAPEYLDGKSAARFDGGGIEVVDPQLGVGGGAVTVTWWMRPDPEQQQNAVLIDHRAGIETTSARERATHGFSVSLNSGRVSVQVADGQTSQNYVFDNADVLPNPTRWMMITVSIGHSLRVYVDNTRVGEITANELGARSDVSREANGRSLFIGRHRIDGGPSFRGALADVQIFDSELTGEDAAALYDAAAATRQPLPAQHGWLGCVTCGCLVFTEDGGATPLGCQALGAGQHALDTTVAYEIEPAADGVAHDGWARCAKCAVAFFAPFASVSACGAGGEHEVAERLGPVAMLDAPDLTAAEPPRRGPRVLFLGANKRGHTVLELQTEKRYLEEVADSSSLDVRGLLNASAATISQELHDNGPSIVQFSAHGTDDEAGSGLWLADAHEPTSGEELAALFADAQSSRSDDGVQLVVLNACRSVSTAEAIAQHVPYVVAVSEDIPDEAAVFFTPLLYEQLANGREIGAAVAHARRQLVDVAHFESNQIPDLVGPNTQEHAL